jgi:hypothetical protein
LRRKFRTIAGLKAVSAVRDIAPVCGKGHLLRFQLAQTGAVAAFPTVLAVSQVLSPINALTKEKNGPESQERDLCTPSHA